MLFSITASYGKAVNNNPQLRNIISEPPLVSPLPIVMESSYNQNLLFIVIIIILLLIVLIMYLYIRYAVTLPLNKILNNLEGIINGHYNDKVNFNSNIMQKLSDYIYLIQDRLVAIEQDQNEQTLRDKAAQESRRAEREHILDNFENDKNKYNDTIIAAMKVFKGEIASIIEKLSGFAYQLNNNALSLTDMTNNVTMQAGIVSQISLETSETIKSVIFANDHLAAISQKVGEQAEYSTEISNSSVAIATKANYNVKELSASAKRIISVTKLIEDIAAQTNLLALNAAIEAAKAGDSGKSFAIVAGEIKNLAAQTAKATENITEQINEIQTKTREAESAIEKIVVIINDMAQGTTSITQAVAEQVTATIDITQRINDATTGHNNIASGIEQVRASSAKVNETSAQVFSSSSQLKQQALRLRESVHCFLNAARPPL